jgi:D-alanyl-D-alanine carboxypeptidase
MTTRLTITYLFTFSLFISTIGCSRKKSGDTELPEPPSTQQDVATVDNAITAFMTTYSLPGASLAVSKNGKLVYAKGYGFADKEANETVTTRHRFRLASVSKTYTGAAIMKLVQEGKLTLDAKVFGAGAILGTEYGSGTYNTNVSNIKVRDLLQNTTGSWGGNTGGDVIDQNAGYTNAQLLNWVLTTRTNPKTPGTFYDYSNVGFFIAGRVIEKISGKSYVNYIRQDLLPATGATETDMAGKTLADRKANEVKYYGQGTDAAYPYVIAFPRRDADGGLIASASDVLRFITAIDGLNTRADILNPASVTAMTTAPSFSTYAQGIAIWPAENLWFNYGSLPGTRTGFMKHNSNGTCVALLFNSRPGSNENAFAGAMQNLMLNILKGTHNWQENLNQF